MKYYGKKIGFYLVAFWAALTINFLLPRLLPGDPVTTMINKLSAKGPVTPETRASVEAMLGTSTDEPLWEQYVNYIKGIFSGDLGVSVTYFPETVSSVIARSLPWTIGLVGTSMIIAVAIGLYMGHWAGWRRGTRLDTLVPVTAFFQAIPYFWLALILVYLFASKWQIFPAAGGYNVYEVSPGWNLAFIGSVIYYGTLPAITIILSSVGGWMLGMRNMMVSTMSEDYILTAEAKGLTSKRVRTTYAARNAVLPSITGFATTLGFVVAGSIVMEQVFSYPGIGNVLFAAVQNNDYALMQGCFLVITLSVLLANFVVDILYGFFDPRARVEQ